jgi:hypothetical protein
MADLDVLRVLEERSTSLALHLNLHNAYYEGEARLDTVGITIPPQLRALTTVINWPRMYVDELENRLTVEGFRIPGVPGLDERLWDWWQANDLDEESSLGHTEALVTGRSFIVVGINDENPSVPLITVEPPQSMAVDVDSRTRRVNAALRLYRPRHDGLPNAATLYLPNVTRYFVRGQSGWLPDPEYPDVEHGLGEVPVVPMVNRARLADRHGRTEMCDVIPLTDAAVRSMTNLQVAQELLAVPQRYVLGAKPEDFVDSSTGEQVPVWQAYAGRIFALMNEQAKVGQFSAADLRNFTETMSFYGKQVATVTGLPPHYLGFSSDNPASADAIRSSEARLVKKAEDRARTFSGAWERAMRLAVRLIDGSDSADRLETVWADPSTPTFAAKADAVVKLYAAGLIPREAAWDALGYSAEQQRQYAALMTDDMLEKLIRSVGATNGPGSVPSSAGSGVPDTLAAGPAGALGTGRPTG